MSFKGKALLLGCAVLAVQGCAAGRAVSKAGGLAVSSGSAASRAMMRAVGVDNADQMTEQAQVEGDHWSEGWVWEGEAP